MSLDKDKLSKAVYVFNNHDGGTSASIEAAIETYLEEMFKPGQLIMGDASQPVRDYRKELWIGVRLQDFDPDSANAALAEFDKTFQKDPS